jgi:PiT family inorganic phosphate transporter
MAAGLGVPVSALHAIIGIGIGAAHSAVRWEVASSIVVASVITIPAAAAIAALAFALAGFF